MGLGVESGQAILPRHEDVLLVVMFDQQRSRVSGSDGTIDFPGDLAGQFVKADQKAGTIVVVPGKDDGIIEKRLYEWADALRTVGNEAAHDVGADVSRDDARDLL